MKRLLKVLRHIRENFYKLLLQFPHVLIDFTVGKIENQEKVVELLLQNGAKDDLAIFAAASKKGSSSSFLIYWKDIS